MSDLTTRNGSQILRTFLPQQTADLGGRIYRVTEWTSARPLSVDSEVVTRRLLRAIGPWVHQRNDGGLADDLRSGEGLEVLALDTRRGVEVERWPRVWLCRTCRRLGDDLSRSCKCGARQWGQLHFVGFHSCGAVVEPWVRRCPTHDEVKLVSPRSAAAKDIRFVCPICNSEVGRGLGFQQCACGGGLVQWNVHKARSVYAPRSMVLVNPARPERMRELAATGGARRALAWVLDGMVARDPGTTGTSISRGAFVDDLVVNKKIPEALAEQMADLAEAGNQFATDDASAEVDALEDSVRHEAEHNAVELAMAVSESRVMTTDLSDVEVGGAKGVKFAHDYPNVLTLAGVEGVDLIDRFPVLNAVFGFTRGGGDPGVDRLVAFRNPRGGYRLYGEQVETEALLVRLDPVRVLSWLQARGHHLDMPSGPATPRESRVAILRHARIPDPGESVRGDVGTDVLALVHSYAHRLIRQASVFAGIDRDALAEYLVPAHLSFFVYAAARGDFVLGGLQAVFENDLDLLFKAVVRAEHRCPLDPGCARGSGACVGCMHLGEPSCRYFNSDLSRPALFGRHGYLATSAASTVPGGVGVLHGSTP